MWSTKIHTKILAFLIIIPIFVACNRDDDMESHVVDNGYCFQYIFSSFGEELEESNKLFIAMYQ